MPNPTCNYDVPEAQIISGGFDILSHIMENYFGAPDEENVSNAPNARFNIFELGLYAGTCWKYTVIPPTLKFIQSGIYGT